MPISRVAALLLVTGARAGATSAPTPRRRCPCAISVPPATDAIDDTPAIQRAIDAVGEAGVVFFPPGTYRVTQLRVGSRIALVGAAPGAVTLRNTAARGSELLRHRHERRARPGASPTWRSAI